MATQPGFDPFAFLSGGPIGGVDLSGGGGPAVSGVTDPDTTNIGVSTFVSPPFTVVGPGGEFDGNVDQYGGTDANPSQSASSEGDQEGVAVLIAAGAVVLVALHMVMR